MDRNYGILSTFNMPDSDNTASNAAMSASALPPNVHISTHPCVRAKLSQLRSQSTGSADVQRLVHEIATMVGCEALAAGAVDVVAEGVDTTPLSYPYTPAILTPSKISLVPILRSGLSMVPALQALLPHPVPVHHLGMYREKSTLQPVEYYNNLPYHKSGEQSTVSDLAVIVDPIVATGSTLCAAIDTLRDWGVRRILAVNILGSREGVVRAAEAWPEGVEVWVGGCDAEMDERGMLKPGLGDVGDRLYLTLGK